MGIQLSRKGGRRVPLTIAFLALAVTGIGATAWIAARNRSHDAVVRAPKVNKDSPDFLLSYGPGGDSAAG